MRVEIRSLLDSRTFLSRSDGKVVGNRSSDRLEGWWHGEGVEGGSSWNCQRAREEKTLSLGCSASSP